MAAPMDIWRGAGNGAEKRRNACIKEQCCRRSCVAVGQMAKWSFDDDSIEHRRSESSGRADRNAWQQERGTATTIHAELQSESPTTPK
mmetsp:Transcript_23309/g.39837  ORF Transcript_23309/g.39837 Transcript_23309/m.39837 type:complete len:88 (+) Transcript_23309:374-637(+)